MIASRITSKGQTTIPLAVRESLGIKEHDRLVYELRDGEAVIRPLRGTILDHRGSIRPKKRPEDFEAVRQKAKGKTARRAAER